MEEIMEMLDEKISNSDSYYKVIDGDKNSLYIEDENGRHFKIEVKRLD